MGERFVVRPGETVATDGEVVLGQSAIDRSVMTGESRPVDVGPGDAVLGGTVSLTGRVVVQATRVGRETQLGQMLRLVEHAQNEKAAVQQLADRVSSVFVPAVLLLALGTLVVWLADGQSRDGGDQRCPLGTDHRLPVRARPCDAGRAARGLLGGGAAGDLLQGLRGARGVSPRRHRRARQDRHADRRAG